MTTNLQAFIYLDKSVQTKITMGDGTIHEACGKRDVQIFPGDEKCIKDVLYVPHLKLNSLSVGQFLKSVVFEDLSCVVFSNISKKNLLFNVLMAKNNIFPLYLDGEQHVFKASLEDKILLWHHRYGHLNFKSLNYLSHNNLIDGMRPIQHIGEICESCVFGKQHREAFHKNNARQASELIELAHSYICGPMRTSLNNSTYFIVFVDDHSRCI